MIYRSLFLIFFFLCVGLPVGAQSNLSSFDEFRKNAFSQFGEFRRNAMDEYASFLEGAWKEYESIKGEVRDRSPKPKVCPVAPETKPATPSPSPVKPVTPSTPSVSKPTVPSLPPSTPAPKPQVTPSPAVPRDDTPQFRFVCYGISMSAPEMKLEHVTGMEGKDVARAWNNYNKAPWKNVVDALKNIIQEYGFNDWFALQTVRAYADGMGGGNADRVVLQHFLLTAMGYDVRLAHTREQMALLVPFEQQMYACTYLKIGGEKYYLLFDERDAIAPSQSVYTCDMPAGRDYGKKLNLRIENDMRVSVGDNTHRVLRASDIIVEADVNNGMMEMLRHYPQMDVEEYAMSSPMHNLRQKVLEQVRPSVAGLSKRDAANKLLTFVQKAFDYATDGQQHGYEKAYFIEENFYYPKNDCEDRAIFFAFLVRNLLGLDVQLVQFPGHECTAVCFDDNDVSGDSYIHNGKRYVICDPTYIGASIGECMPDYKGVQPKIGLW